MSINVWNREPIAGRSPTTSGNESMDVWHPEQGMGKSLNDGHHCGAYIFIFDCGSHELIYCVISGATELPKKLSVEEEIGSKHFGYSEDPLSVSDVLEKLILEISGKGSGSFGVT